MHYLIGVEFWKQLFGFLHENIKESTYHSIYHISFAKKRYVYSLNNFTFKKPSLGKQIFDLTGYMILMDKEELETIDRNIYAFKYRGGSIKEGETLLSVCPDWKHFRVFYRLFHYKDSTLVPLTDSTEINVKESIGENAIVESAGKSNLELMKIRLAPEIDFKAIYNFKVLIIGSGTLGCNVARGLLSWGIEYITFVDNSKVGASNLLRQSLFESSDLGKEKAIAASERVVKIFPPAQGKVSGFQFTIPMPDHPDSANNLSENVERLENLILQNDLIFLCTDNRESRWLPSLIAIAHNKPVINLALGFNSYVIMRHPLSTYHCKVTFPNLNKKESVPPPSLQPNSSSCPSLVDVDSNSECDEHNQNDEEIQLSLGLQSCQDELALPPVQFEKEKVCHKCHTIPYPSTDLTKKSINILQVPVINDGKSNANRFISANMGLSPSDLGGYGLSITSIGRIAIGSMEIGSSYGSIEYSKLPEIMNDNILNVDQFGCYFCPSVEGVKNSVRDQALDERCTVTRGGASMICSALGVELAVGLITHKKGFYANGGKNCEYGEQGSLSKINPPQQIRGNLTDFSSTQYIVRRNPNCVCCSAQIIQYFKDPVIRHKFLENICQDSSLLTSLNGDNYLDFDDSMIEPID